ncbi:GerAB/ArcD/ProY family transporter [Paenibacillus segetis]|uniref:Germination protein n=1 Tax=Paenibacillus segetis TaxID=1325360 RepID=A0ABQ1YUG1_9BACL|nr:endospore germination permease [Paenibacillus segetis]GGH36970.1 germination protein [Paenibacillus segetis]
MTKDNGTVNLLGKVNISSRQFSIVVALYMVGSAILNIPAMLQIVAKQDTWMAAVLGMAVGLIILPLYIYLGKRFSQAIFTWYTERLLGKWIGKVISLLFIFTFPVLIAILTLRNIGDFMTTQIMMDTPIQAILIIIMSVVIMATRLGLEPLARAAELFFPFVILLFILFIVLVFPHVSFKFVQPMLDNGIKPVLRASLIFIAYPFLEPIVLIMIFPFVSRTDKNGKALFTGIFIGGVILVVITTLTILVLGTKTVSYAYPSFALAKTISMGNFLQRIEVIMAFMWFITIFVRLALLFYISAVGIAHTLNMKEYRFLTFPLALIMITLAIVAFPNAAYFQEFTPIWTIHAIMMGLMFPLLLWLIDLIRGGKRV